MGVLASPLKIAVCQHRATFTMIFWPVILSVLLASQTVRIEEQLEKYKNELFDSMTAKVTTLRNRLIVLDFKKSDDLKMALSKLEEFGQGLFHSLFNHDINVVK